MQGVHRQSIQAEEILVTKARKLIGDRFRPRHFDEFFSSLTTLAFFGRDKFNLKVISIFCVLRLETAFSICFVPSLTPGTME